MWDREARDRAGGARARRGERGARMGLRGSDPFVEQVRLATDILAVISPFLELHKAGKRWKGRCPFHAEKTPSFFVNQENQTFYCFGCREGGDVFTFLMMMEKVTFPDALKMLAERAGIEIPRRRFPGAAEGDDRLGEAIEVAASFFSDRLRSQEGGPARDYLMRRGIDEEQIARFGLGWAPASWDALLQHARRLLPERVLLSAGLVVEGERGLYDRFRERVMIPIRTPGGRPVAFGGRLLGDGEPKYLNSPETPLYKKGAILFGLSQARDAIRAEENVLVVEGYFDVISLSTAGIGWVVGSCGTALTAEQAMLLRRYAERWVLLFDGDAAGRTAVLRALDAAVPVHPGVRVALCPKGLDPDSWVRAEGPAAVRQALSRSYTPLQYVEEHVREEGLAPEVVLSRVADLLRKITDPLVRDLWVQDAAGRFRIREARIYEAIGRAGPGTASRPQPIAPAAASPERRPMGQRERQIVAVAVASPSLAAELREACAEIPEIDSRCGDLLAWIAERYLEGIVDEAALLSSASEDPDIWRGLDFLHGETGSVAEVPVDLVPRLRALGLQRRMRDLTDRIRRAEERGEPIVSLLKEKQDLAAALRETEAPDGERKSNFP